MRVSSKFATVVLALLLAQPVISSSQGPQALVASNSSVSDTGENTAEPRRFHGRSRWRVLEEVVEVRSPRPDDKDDKTTLTTSTTTTSNTLATTTSPNTWVVVQHVTGTSYSTVTCMTPTTVATSACSYINDKTTTCAATSAVVPTCVPGMLCYFSQTNGAVSCAHKGGMQLSGFIVVGVLGLAAAAAFTAITVMCCQERRARKAVRKSAEVRAAMMAASEAKKAPRVDVVEVGRGGYATLKGAVPDGDEAPDAYDGAVDSGRGQEQRYGDADPFDNEHERGHGY